MHCKGQMRGWGGGSQWRADGSVQSFRGEWSQGEVMQLNLLPVGKGLVKGSDRGAPHISDSNRTTSSRGPGGDIGGHVSVTLPAYCAFAY